MLQKRDPAADAEARKKAVRATKKAFKHLGLDIKQPADWERLHAIVLESDLDKRRKRKRGRKLEFGVEWLALVGLLVEILKITHPEVQSDAKRAEIIKALLQVSNAKRIENWKRFQKAFPEVPEAEEVFKNRPYLASAESLRKRFPEARRAYIEWLDRNGYLDRFKPSTPDSLSKN